jgi:nucleoside-diphosphate-sugar epimerase
MNKVLKTDIEEFVHDFPHKDSLKAKTFLITGATGLIGSTLCRCLIGLNEEYKLGIRITCPVRNLEKANNLFGNQVCMFVKERDLESFLDSYTGNIDYIIHCASPTGSKYMVSNPVETYTYMIESTLLLLRYAKEHPIHSMVYVSSLEYYGQLLKDEIITEDKVGFIDSTSPRSSYPLGKHAAEFACVAFAKEYGIPVKVARLTQTFGAGIAKTENRVFAQFARAAINGDNIVLKSSGKSSKPYSYTTDTASGILTILLNGEDGEAYNVANDDTYISINDMAKLVKDIFNPNINIIHDIDPNSGYAPDTLLHLSSKKLRSLGWKPKYGIVEMFKRLIEYLSD